MLGVAVAIIRDEHILLTKREDFEVWCLPGGSGEINELVTQTAIREIREEVGLEIELVRLVGIYCAPLGRARSSHTILFAAKPITHTLRLQPNEVLEARYFAHDDLPTPLLWWDRQRILDALDGVGGSVVWHQDMVWPFEPTMKRKNIYQLRDQSGLSRQEFFLKYFEQPEAKIERLEVGGKQD